MNIPSQYLKLMPLLLIVSAIVFITSDQIRSQKGQTAQQLAPKGIDDGHIHSHDEGVMDHSDPVAQKRMGIFHYNEGNKFLKQNDWKQAIRNYKMALHHNKEFTEAYINLSTAYLKDKQLDASLKTLNTLQKIEEKHPLLHYNLACYYAIKGDTARGMASLKLALEYGLKNIESLLSDPDLEKLRRDPQFQELQIKLTKKKI
jgi:tetratricopeptide (TPR) repeat protein